MQKPICSISLTITSKKNGACIVLGFQLSPAKTGNDFSTLSFHVFERSMTIASHQVTGM